jgi:hypothetical protein
MERRRHERHKVSAAVKLYWKSLESTHLQGTGVTRDFSAVGLFVITDDHPPPVGTDLHFEVDLETPSLGSAVTVRAKGKVNRIETTDLTGRPGGFAISTRRMRLEKAKAPPPRDRVRAGLEIDTGWPGSCSPSRVIWTRRVCNPQGGSLSKIKTRGHPRYL